MFIVGREEQSRSHCPFSSSSHSRPQDRTALFARDWKNDEVWERATVLLTNPTPTFLEYEMQTIGHDTEITFLA